MAVVEAVTDAEAVALSQGLASQVPGPDEPPISLDRASAAMEALMNLAESSPTPMSKQIL
jgi:hypothetical protein